MPTDTDTWISLLQLVVSIAGVVITIWLALIVQRSAARLTKLELARAIRDTWLHVDDVTLSDPDLVRLVEQFQPPRETADPAFPKKRLFLLVFLNPLQTTYQAAREGFFGPNGAKSIEAVKSQLAHVVKDDDAYWVTQNQGYDPDFMALCREVREQVKPHAAAA